MNVLQEGSMFSIEHSLLHFTQALLQGQSVVATAKGQWAIEGSIRKTMRQIFGREPSRLADLAHAFSDILDRLEEIPVEFSTSEQQRDFVAYVDAAEAIMARLQRYNAPFAVNAYQGLAMRTIALRFRLEAANGGLNSQAPRADLQKALHDHALQWKETLEVVFEKDLDEQQHAAIEEICRFPAFAEILLHNRTLREEFYNWSLRDKNPAAIFVEFPALRRKIVDNAMNGRIGRMGGGRILKLIKEPCENGSRKVVTLPFEGIDHNILDPAYVIEFRGSYKLSIEEIFKVFHDKYLRVGNLEFMQEGIINWNVQHWGWWNAATNHFHKVDLTQDGWWTQFPFFETLTKHEAKLRYGSEADGIQWLAAATATRGRASLDVDLTHAYLEVAIPIDLDHYAIFDFGKQANEFPATYIDTLKMVCTTVHATIAHPDENVYYTHRQHAQHVCALTPEEGLKMMHTIKKDMISSRGLNFVYQIESENCAKWVHEKLEAALGINRVPNLFMMSIFHTEAISVLGAIIRFCKIFPEAWQIKALTFFHLPLGASKGHWVLEHGRLIWRALTHHTFWNTGTIYLPCFLHKQKELGNLHTNENILYTFDTVENTDPYPREFTRRREKDAVQQPPNVQTLTQNLNRLGSTLYDYLQSLKKFTKPPREKRLGLPVFFPIGMRFARL